MTNKGVELTLSVEPISNRHIRWDILGSSSKNTNKVLRIFQGITTFSIPGSAFIGSLPSIKVGQPYGVIIGGLIPRDSTTGAPLINAGTGVYATTIANQVLSNPNPNYIIGVTNTFKYKTLSLGFTFNFIKGGHAFSLTAASSK